MFLFIFLSIWDPVLNRIFFQNGICFQVCEFGITSKPIYYNSAYIRISSWVRGNRKLLQPWLLLQFWSFYQFSSCVCSTASSGSLPHLNRVKRVSAKTADYSTAFFLDFLHITLFFEDMWDFQLIKIKIWTQELHFCYLLITLWLTCYAIWAKYKHCGNILRILVQINDMENLSNYKMAVHD